MKYPMLYEAARILSDNNTDLSACIEVLEDTASPITQKYTEQLYEDIIAKGHIDFGDISKSAGDITKYSGFECMKNTLTTLEELAKEQRSESVLRYVNTINTAIARIVVFKPEYTKGFMVDAEFVKLKYNTFVFACVEATSTLLYEFVDYIKEPTAQTYEITLKNTKLRANVFFFDQLDSFIRGTNPPTEHAKMLAMYNNKGKSNFIGSSTLLGAGVVIAAALSIIPVTRHVIYTVYKLRGDLSQSLRLQASFLEMNKLCVQSNSSFDAAKKKSILDKQKKQMQILIKLSDILKVKDAKATMDATREVKAANSSITRDSVQKRVEDSPLVLV